MPIKPNSGETKDEFISRCMSEESSAFPNQSQRFAVCNNYWEKRNIMKSTEQKVLNKLNVIEGRRLESYKGINLNEDGSVNLEEPCQKGYRQFGTKILNGREVPDCRGPIEGVDQYLLYFPCLQ